MCLAFGTMNEHSSQQLRLACAILGLEATYSPGGAWQIRRLGASVLEPVLTFDKEQTSADVLRILAAASRVAGGRRPRLYLDPLELAEVEAI